MLCKGRSSLARSVVATLASIIFALRKDYVIKTHRALGFSSAPLLRQITPMELLHFSFALLEEERSQRAQVETGLYPRISILS